MTTTGEGRDIIFYIPTVFSLEEAHENQTNSANIIYIILYYYIYPLQYLGSSRRLSNQYLQ